MSELSSTQTAAVVMMNLDRALAVEVMKHLTDDEAESIAAEIIRLRNLDAETTSRALSDFHRIVQGHLPPARGGRDIAAGLLSASFGAERAEGVLTKVSSAMTGSSFDFLSAVEPAQIASVVDGELPHTIALVLAHLPVDSAAAVLAELSDPLRTDVAQAIATMGTASQDAVAIVADALRARSGAFAMRDSPEVLGGVQPLVDIINRSDATVEKALLANLEARDSTLAEDIRSRMFTFADVVVLDDRDAQRVLRGIEIRVLALALKGAPASVAAVIRRNMSERNRETLDEEAQTLGAVRVSQVEEARAEIVRVIRALEAAGDIRVQRGDEEEYVS
ncbi:flagellar motor switch protein FliG [Microbacterium sp. zg.Y1090]|uniref:flagellar motor switch protein FliG n=1 Tax=Microbacterium TaxID=33882 RepID=UPI00214BB712|nr:MULTISPECIES: flagellar motor switch protein FliG [unclassified Microbacterium]MCR2813979.1 flagellar motor switch protein FliG [Microbacterium sp. zg.Y1084]MCR2819253.1 flagellar motor switch protein FliG [Microbacterium sp. zg.Y1090]MDL5487170.1 flagellar motor switch protein FliG [Microbacterium sp. zg-Y1211]WIM28235.1 flagellar motor switch protein FliG [Microbacterium sp. zg-Y1090]